MRRLLPILSLLLIIVIGVFLFSDFFNPVEKNSAAIAGDNSQSTIKSAESLPTVNSPAACHPPLRPAATAVSDTFLLPDSLASIDTLLVARKNAYRMHLYHKGKLQKTYIIGLGQEPLGHKQQQGDNRTPEGTYKIIQKSRGPFYGDYAQYLGDAWLRLNYPNNADAIAGYQKGLITSAQKNAIIQANNAGKEPPKNTKLGGGIGIHGWYGEWPGCDKQNLTWGCISIQNKELVDLYDRVRVGTIIVIVP